MERLIGGGELPGRVTASGPRWATGLLVLVVIAGAVVPLTASITLGQETATSGGSENSSSQATPTTYPPHDGPDGEGEAADPEAVETWLEFRLYSQLNSSVHHLQAGRLVAARTSFDSDYDTHLEQLAAMYAETGDPVERVEYFEQARRQQLRLIDQVEAYRDTSERYRDAKLAADGTLADELGPQSRLRATEALETTEALLSTYRTLGNQTSPPFFNALQAADLVRVDLNATRTRIPDSVEATTMSVTVNATDPVPPGGYPSSPSDPLPVEGELRTEGGDPVAHQTIEVRMGARVVETRTLWNGTFYASFRPIEVPPGSQEVTVRYLPAIDEAYLASGTTLSVHVETAEPTVTANAQPATARYPENVTVRGNVSVDRTGVGSVPLQISLDGTQIGSVETDRHGGFQFEMPVHADQSPGAHVVVVRTATDGWALSPVEATVTFEVPSTDTRLTAMATPVNESHLEVNGRLTTGADRPVRDGTVSIVSGGVTVASAQTDRDGRFVVSLEQRSLLDPDAAVTVRFQPDGGHLAAATVEVPVDDRATSEGSLLSIFEPWSAASGPSTVGDAVDERSVLAVVFGWALLVAIGAVYGRRRDHQSTDYAVEGRELAPRSRTEPSGIEPERLLRFADDRLAAGDTDIAVIAAYAALRQPGGFSNGSDRGLTHREFLQQFESDGLDPEHHRTLRIVTERSELAAFQPTTLTEADASEAVTLTRQLLGRD